MKKCEIMFDDGVICGRPAFCKEMCRTHYGRSRRGAALGRPFHGSYKDVTACSLCDRPAMSRGLCSVHYQRQHIRPPAKRLMALDAPVREKGLSDEVKVERILATARPDGECLIAARIGSDGYATSVKDAQGLGIKSHRLIYRVKVGPLPKGEQVHHVCANRGCINPEHLIAATQRENTAEMHARRSYEQRIAALEAENADLRARLAKAGMA